MRLRFSILGALVAALCISLVGVASASAHLFKASKETNITSKVEAGAVGVQKFVVNGADFECTEANGTGKAVVSSLTRLINVTYGKCNVGGVKLIVRPESGTPETAGPVSYLFSADELVLTETPIVIEGNKEEGGATECLVKVPAGQDLRTIKYENVGSNILEITNVSGIESTGVEGAATSCKYATQKSGTYTGDSLVQSTEGATLSWE